MSVPWRKHHKLPRRLPLERRFNRYGLSFESSLGNRVEMPTLLDTVPAALTLIIWVKFDNVGVSQEILRKVNIDKQDRIYLYRRDTNLFGFDTEEHDNGYKKLDGTTVTVTDRWYFVGATWDGVNGKRLYVNGELENSDPAETTLMANGTFTDFEISGSNFRMDADVAFFGCYSYTFSPQQMRNAYLRGVLRFDPNALCLLPLEEGTGTSATDISGSGEHGSLLPALTPPVWTRIAEHELLAEAEV